MAPETARIEQGRTMTDQAPQSKTILVVEDEDGVREVITRGLREAGYHVLEAGDGVQALAVVLAAAVKIDLLVADIVMPNMGGLQLAERLTVDGKHPIFLFITGYDQDWSKISGAGLEKPFRPDELVAEVRRLLLLA
jgi:two-component system, cell cycle sensor histidine kinase and response regulator CckA